jgi:hypothetical protein
MKTDVFFFVPILTMAMVGTHVKRSKLWLLGCNWTKRQCLFFTQAIQRGHLLHLSVESALHLLLLGLLRRWLLTVRALCQIVAAFIFT